MVLVCGIVGYIGTDEAFPLIIQSLEKLEYRGYDSAGVALLGSDIKVVKVVGGIDKLKNKILEGRVGIGHTRWATHGGVSERNAHPHLSCDGEIAVVHNGIIENWEELKEELRNHKFVSETDTEVVAHFLEERLGKGLSMEEALKELKSRLKGTYALVILKKGDDRIYALKKDSPLVLGILESGFMLASDIYAFSDKTNKAIFFEDGEHAIIRRNEYRFFDSENRVVEKRIENFSWSSGKEEIGNFEHYMLKEIHEEPNAVRRLLLSLRTDQREKLEALKKLMETKRKVMFVASGSSYFASLLGVYFLHRAGIESQTLIASEFHNYERVNGDTLVIPISQSGETMDVLDAVKLSKRKGAEIVSIVNVPHSSIQRESRFSLEIKAGQEVCVAATKTFINQVVLLMELASLFGYRAELDTLPQEIEHVIKSNEKTIRKLARRLKDKNDIYIIGRGVTYPVAREIALKLKEIAYIHAEGMMGGELKHGTLALIEEGVPVISLIPSKDDEVMSNVIEVESRGAMSIRISPESKEFKIPQTNSGKFAVFSVVLGQLLAYYIAKERGLPIDKPRNLAKSVTVK
ncbi:MAG: glutamine--fructose-6-phosphate transaminase (isomerizing) [Candidatus Aenigmatarchaeota archaeon]|nr:MAG: glutamine--fructose-6-phosphate transaminase (isomerizing) [Candidatus Aenigmarchaeota archaeon]